MYGDEQRAVLITKTATFITLITVGSRLFFPVGPIPVTLQTFFVLLAGASMKRWGGVPVLLYVILGILGLPVFSGGLAGIGVLLSPKGGYLVGFIPAAAITGMVYERTSPLMRVVGITLATLIIYVCGLSWYIYSTGISLPVALLSGFLIFLPFDTLKGVLVYFVARRLP